MKGTLATVSKAIAGGVVAALSFAIPIVDDGISLSEGMGIALAFIVGTGIVYAAPANRPKPPA